MRAGNTTAILRVGTVPLFAQPRSKRSGKRARDLDRAIRHNRRLYQPANADPARRHLNYALAGQVVAKDVYPAALAMYKARGITPRKNASIIELLFTIPPNFAMEETAFFDRCLAFSESQFGAQNIITADVHRDESVPHLHVLIMPISGGKLRATTLLGSLIKRLIGGKLLRSYEIQVTFEAELKQWLNAAKRPAKSARKRARNIEFPYSCISAARHLKSRASKTAIRRAGHRKRTSASGLHRQFVHLGTRK